MRGRFITFEGGEGTGKSTQVALLEKRLGAFGVPVVTTREPGGSPGAEAIRHVLLSGAAKPLGAYAEAILFARASRRRGRAVADRFETEALDFHKKLREAYVELAGGEPGRCVVIDASASPNEVSDAIWAVVNARLRPAETPLMIEDLAK